MAEILDIINEHDQIIGQATREEAHRHGLLHREIQVWLYTPHDELIFQHRSPFKETSPNLLDATCAGHVEHGAGWLDTAVKELQEETGLEVRPEDLTHITSFHLDNKNNNGRHNNSLRKVYAYCYRGRVDDLIPDPTEAVGFVSRSLTEVLILSEDQLKAFAGSIRQPWYKERVFNHIQAFIGVSV